MLARRGFLYALFVVLQFCVLAPASADERTIVDSAGRSVRVPEKIDRVLAAGPPASVLLYVLAPEKMVGWVREPSTEEKEFLAGPYRDLPAYGMLTGKGNTANLETVLALKPDLIVDVGTVDPTYASLADRVQQQTGIPYILIDGSFVRTPQILREAGNLLGVTGRGEELARYAEDVMREIDTVLAGVTADERPRVYYGRGPKGLETGLAGSINTEILGAVGAVNVAQSAGKGGLANVSLEQVLGWDPDVILARSPAFQHDVMSDPSWAGVAAVRQGRVYGVPSLPFGWFDSPPGVNRLIGVPWLLSVLYPDKSPVDPAAAAYSFYHLFYHVDLTDGQLDGLLAGSRTGP
ncbi:MAG: iron ABC transporter substrate-binding protein [Rhizobiales bacterium]|nr:iron ABC transporter substrate-binding protein [Hyphomicrobiales bacterium]